LTDQGQLAEMKLKNKPYDLDSWETLIKEAQVRGLNVIAFYYCSYLQTSALIRGRMLFEKLVERFPTCGRFWRIYIEQEVVKHGSIVLVYNSIGQSEHVLISMILTLPIVLHGVNLKFVSRLHGCKVACWVLG